MRNDIGFDAALRSFFQLFQKQSIACSAAVPERFQSAARETRHGTQKVSQTIGTAGIKRHGGAATDLSHALEDGAGGGVVAFLK